MSDAQLSEDQARRLWERAAQLQEDARRREEEAQRLLPVAQPEPEGFALEHVRQAAIEAGIDASFVDAAWRESRVGVNPPKPSVDRRITLFLGDEPRALEQSRTIAAPPALVLEAIHDVLTSDACKLTLSDQLGGHPLEGGTLVFTPTVDYSTAIGKAVMYSDMRHFLVSLESRGPEDQGPTEVKIRAPMEYSRKLNYRVGVGLNGVVSAGGVAGAVAGATALGLALPLVAVAGAAGLAASWWAGLRSYRAIFRFALRKGREGLDLLLRQIAVHVETRSHRPERTFPPARAGDTES